MTQNESFKLLPRPALPVENCSFVTHRMRDEMKEKVQQKSRRLKAEYLRDGGEEKEKKIVVKVSSSSSAPQSIAV